MTPGVATGSLEEADWSEPAAGICDPVTGATVSFDLGIDTPAPRCARVLGTQRLRLNNTTGADVTVTLHGREYVLRAHSGGTFDVTFGEIWKPGVHTIRTSLYGGGGPEVVLVEE